MSETKQCKVCGESPPYKDGPCRGGYDMPCARLVMYETAKLPPNCDRGDAVNLALNTIDEEAAAALTAKGVMVLRDGVLKMDEHIGELLSYAARLACDLLMVNGTIQKAARDAEKYIEVVHKAEKERS